ncbi:MAG: hypothetical protein R3E87_14525 [Burkholderiaceae bacterium]
MPAPEAMTAAGIAAFEGLGPRGKRPSVAVGVRTESFVSECVRHVDRLRVSPRCAGRRTRLADGPPPADGAAPQPTSTGFPRMHEDQNAGTALANGELPGRQCPLNPTKYQENEMKFERPIQRLAVAIAVAGVFGAANAADGTSDSTRSTGMTPPPATGDAGAKMKQAASDATSKTQEVGRDAMQSARETTREAGNAVRDAAQDTAQATRDVANDVKQGAANMTENAREGVRSAAAATDRTMDQAGRRFESWSDRAHMGRYTDAKEQLAEQLRAVNTRDGYRAAIENAGYMITAINEQSDDEIEYEVVKGDTSYEVQLDFNDGTSKASSVDVSSNLWRAAETKRAMNEADYRPGAVAYDRSVGDRYRDRTYAQDMGNEKQRLEAVLKPGMSTTDLTNKLQQEGYQVTSINDREPTYLEFEIVKARNSFEVQVDRDPTSGVARTVDVTANVWQSQATERALGEE